eukprot:9648730-Alexandrium_andersonii.AAC.1
MFRLLVWVLGLARVWGLAMAVAVWPAGPSAFCALYARGALCWILSLGLGVLLRVSGGSPEALRMLSGARSSSEPSGAP